MGPRSGPAAGSRSCPWLSSVNSGNLAVRAVLWPMDCTMPANLTPDYERAEKEYRQASTDEEKLDALREMLRNIPKHKGTERMQADLKRRISQLRKAEGKKGAGRGIDPFHVPKSGAGQIILVGPPNVGKSMLMATTTNALAKVGDYPFTTAVPAPGMWQYEDVQIQLVDTPPMTDGHIPAGLVGTIRLADIISIVVDAAADPLEQTEMVLNLLDAKNISLRSVPHGELDEEDPGVRSGIIVANKVDTAPPENISVLCEIYAGKLEVHPVSAATGEGLEQLAERLWQLLGVIRVYTKQPGRPADYATPFTLHVGSTVEDLAREIHRELPEKMKFARMWGEGRHNGQQVRRNQDLHDRDVVEIHQ